MIEKLAQPIELSKIFNDIGKNIFDNSSRFDNTISSFLPRSGTWSGEKGNSVWFPNKDEIPKKYNPNDKTWGDILKEYKIEGIEFNDGEPNFDDVKVAEVKIDNFTPDRTKNFPQADKELAKQWTNEGKDGKTWTSRDIAEWRKENNCTWHECKDCKTMQLVPKEIHNNVPHAGGISEAKKQS